MKRLLTLLAALLVGVLAAAVPARKGAFTVTQPDGSTKRKAIARAVQLMGELAQGGAVYQGKVFINHAECLPDAMATASAIRSEFTSIDGKVEIFPIGATIGCHTGPGTVVVSFWGKPRG